MKLNDKGMTLIETLIVAAVLGILSLGAAQLMVNQAKNQKQILQKAEAIDLKNQLTVLLGDAANCACHFQGTFDKNQTPKPQMTGISSINKSCTAGADSLIQTGQVYPSSQTGLAVRSIELINISPTGVADQYTADLRIAWDPQTTVANYAPVLIPMVLHAQAGQPDSAQRVASCGGVSATPAYICQTLGGTWDAPTQKCNGVGGGGGGGGGGGPVCQNEDVPPPPTNWWVGAAPGTCEPMCPYSVGGLGYYVCTGQGWKCMGGACNAPPSHDDGL